MTVVSNDPSLWPLISLNIYLSYWTIAAAVVVIYDLVLTIGQEIELIWRQPWSLMTLMYLLIRYMGIPYSVIHFIASAPFVSLTDARCGSMYYTLNGTNMAVGAMLCVVVITRLYAMYQGSRMILIFLVIIFVLDAISGGVTAVLGLVNFVGEEWMISGTYVCNYILEGDAQLLISVTWVLYTVWEVLALCLAVWISVKHFRDLRRLGSSTGSTIRDCFTVLIKSHVLYFASVFCVSFLEVAFFFPDLLNSNSIGVQTFVGALRILFVVQMFVLGPRLVLGVREYNAKLVANSDAEASMNSIVFEERVHVSTSSSV